MRSRELLSGVLVCKHGPMHHAASLACASIEGYIVVLYLHVHVHAHTHAYIHMYMPVPAVTTEISLFTVHSTHKWKAIMIEKPCF